MLVIADQDAVTIGRKRRLAGPGEPEKERNLAGGVAVGGAMHRRDLLLGQKELHHAENRFLDLAGVAGPGDDDRPGLEGNSDYRATARAMDRRIGVEERGMKNLEAV